jgi:hypothetical protein
MIKSAQTHLQDSNMRYWTHMTHSFKQSNRLVAIAVKSYIHGVCPWLFASEGPVGVYKIYKEIRNIRHIKKILNNQR